MYGGDDNRIIVYNMKMWLKEGDQKITREKTLENNSLNIGNRVHQQDIIT